MATKHFFNNREISIPGAYAAIKSGIKNPSLALAYGNTLVIDTGSGKFFGGGAGVGGTLAQGKDALYTYDNSRDFKKFVRGGLWWFLAQPLFLPGAGAAAGISSLTYVRAKTTVPAEIVVPFGLPSGGVDDGSVTVQVRDEGYVGNGVLGDETRATSTITVTAAGADNDVITITFEGETLGTYTKVTGNTIANVVTGLAASVNAIGLGEAVSVNATSFTLRAPRGKAASANTLSPTVAGTGTIAGTSTAFSGGVEGTILTRGYAAKVIAGVLDTTKFIVQFWRGSFTGLDSDISNGTPYDGIAETATKAELVCQSPEVSNVTQLVAWMNDAGGAGYDFNQRFKLKSSVIATNDTILSGDKTALFIKATGGTESFTTANLSAVLDSITDLYYDFILVDNWGDSARSANNLAILEWVNNEARIKPDIYVASGKTIAKWNAGSTSSISVAQAFNSQHVSVVHGGAKISDVTGKSLKEYDSIVKAAYLLGLEAGLPPQVPMTFKGIGIQGELHPLNDKEVKLGLNAGVLMTRLDGSSFEVVKGINTLQNNSFLVNPDGTTHSKQLARIERQLNKELQINMKQQLLKKRNGANRSTVSPEDVKEWTKGFLQTKVANPNGLNGDNLILSFQNVEVSVSGDAYDITYAFVPNFEVSFLFVTGTMIDPNS